MADELVGEDAEHVAQSERVVGVLQHAAVAAAQDVREVLAPGRCGSAVTFGFRPGLPAAVAGPPAELDEQFAAVQLRLAPARRRSSQDSPPTSCR